MADMLRMDRDESIPDAELTLSGRVRRRLLRGEAVDPRQFAAESGGHVSLTSTAVLSLRRLGFDVENVPGPRGVLYRVTNPEHWPSDEAFDKFRTHSTEESRAARERKRARQGAKGTPGRPPKAANTTAAVEPAPPVGGRDVADRDSRIPPLPDLGQPVTVYALALNDDGSITLGLRNGQRRWLTTVAGTVEP
jgi:hypothetical protein